MTRGVLNLPDCPPHEPGEYCCTVGHYDSEMNLLESCYQCQKCGHHIRPDRMDKPVETEFCDICKKKRATSWTVGVEGSSRCSGCRKG